MNVGPLSLVYDEHNVVAFGVIRVEFITQPGCMINEDCPVVTSVGPSAHEDRLPAYVSETITQQHCKSCLARGGGTLDMRDTILIQDVNELRD
jgi:hypothetical protein